jgi:hypothetical protein
MDPRGNPAKASPISHRRLNRLTKMIVLATGLVLIGGSAVGGIAFAASRSSDSPSVHPTTTSSADRHGQGEDGNEQESDQATAKPTGTCAEEKETNHAAGTNHPTTGEREGSMPTTTRSPDADDIRHTGATPTASATHHPEATEAPEANECEGRD